MKRDLEAERRLWRESLELAGRRDALIGPPKTSTYWERSLLAQAYGNLGFLARVAGDLPEARRCYEESLARWRPGGGDALNCAYALLRLGEIAAEMGDADAARERYGESAHIAREVGEGWLERRAADALEGRTERELRWKEDGGRLAEVGGRYLYADVRGGAARDGEETRRVPTVVFESGLAVHWRTWRDVVPEVAKLARTVAYNRAGLTPSDPGPVPRTSGMVVRDLRALLTSLGLEPPYVLVGHSYGGHVARLYPALHPEEVAGLVLASMMHERTPVPQEPPERRQRWLRGGNPGEHIDLATSADELDAAPVRKAIPAVAVINDLPGASGEELERWREPYVRGAQTVPGVEIVFVDDPGHYVHQTRPEAVVEAVKRVLSLAGG